MRVLSGTFDQSDYIRFSKHFGSQCTANEVAGACKANVVNTSLWTSQTVDECLMIGDKLFELSYEQLPTLSLTYIYDLMNCIQHCHFQKMSATLFLITDYISAYEVFDGTSINNIGTVSNDGPTNHCLHDALLCFFHNFNNVIFTCQVESIAAMKIGNQFYVFDSHKRGKNGLCDSTNGKAVVVCFTDINELVVHLKALYKCCRCCSALTASCNNSQLSNSPLLIKNVKIKTNDALSNASET
ncbi:LOW QUALITY PROTEIN: Adenylate cyclase activation protein git1 [Frankliniella fusca]|uniref:Adenylate cyclase activation protein git1 n=1 Tax=Frankliniella fusca TaxID=407009 RepID=A0AAE1LGH2_9NEOP|nr:LOW QUALITY PROTEIN: Adenylate cyclase activation protein git1 [Frankliniella fusca]